MRWLKWVGWAVLVVSLVVGYGWFVYGMTKQHTGRVYEEGRAARAGGVPAEANPFRNEMDRRWWLAGWAAEGGGR